MYNAFLCYKTSDKSEDAIIKFVQPASTEYELILPIQFNVLHGWSDDDVALYR